MEIPTSEQLKKLEEMILEVSQDSSKKREYIALECMLRMLSNPAVMDQGFDTISDFSFRQADSFLKKSREPQV